MLLKEQGRPPLSRAKRTQESELQWLEQESDGGAEGVSLPSDLVQD